jgi:glycosyltransferase involved in cell wall biosynthesis
VSTGAIASAGPPAGADGVLATVTIVVPTSNRPEKLQGCLQALARLDYPSDRLEIVVVDDGSVADLGPVCVAGPDAPPVRLLRQPRSGPAAARNAGAGAATGDVLAFTDDDCRPDPGWLRALLPHVGPGVAAGGSTVNALASNPYADASQHIHELVYAHYNRDHDAGRFFASNNLAMLREDFWAVGGFDEDFVFAAEDRELCDRWSTSGRAMRFAGDAVVRHAHDLTFGGFVRQHLAYGEGAARFHAVRSRRGTGRLRDETAFHLDGRLWLRTLRVRPVGRALRLCALLAVWQAVNAAGFLRGRRSSR